MHIETNSEPEKLLCDRLFALRTRSWLVETFRDCPAGFTSSRKRGAGIQSDASPNHDWVFRGRSLFMLIEVTYTGRDGVDRQRTIPLDARWRGIRRELERCLFDALQEYEFWMQQELNLSDEDRMRMNAALNAMDTIDRELTARDDRDGNLKDTLLGRPGDFKRRRFATRFSRTFPHRNGRVRVII
jgi:hypothetical protein